ncbi:hypothetical protein JCM6882_009070 [Rhodosporidiobolus microsporus]
MVPFRLSLLAAASGLAAAAPAPQSWYEAPLPTTTRGPTPAFTGPWFLAELPSTTTASSTTTEAVTSTTASSNTAAESSSSSTSSSTSTSASAGPTGTVSTKKGVGYSKNQDYLSRNLAVDWVYNWGSVVTGELTDGVTYLPMRALLFPLWGTDDEGWAEDAQKGLDNGADALLGFNEPDIWSQSDMNISTAVDSWKRNFSPFYGKAKLISPAVSNSPQALNLRWLEQFYGNCTQCRDETHAVALHWYSDSEGPEEFKSYFTEAYERLGLPIYITEFGFQRFTSSSNVTQKQEFLEGVIPWLEETSFIERYAAFGTFVGRFVDKDASLTDLGETYSDTV